MGNLLAHETASNGDLSVDDDLHTIELVGRNENCAASSGGIGDERVDDVAPGLIEAGMWFVEQPQLRASSSSDGNGGSSLLAGGKAIDRHVE
jgi:hypothetical protein